MLDMPLGYIIVLRTAVLPCPLFTKVAVVMMPLIYCIKEFISRYDNAARLNKYTIVLILNLLKPFQHFTRVRVSWSPGFVNMILMNILVPKIVLFAKM